MRSYMEMLGLVDVGYSRHYRVEHGNNEFAKGNCHINGIESSLSYAKMRLVQCDLLKNVNVYSSGYAFILSKGVRIIYSPATEFLPEHLCNYTIFEYAKKVNNPLSC